MMPFVDGVTPVDAAWLNGTDTRLDDLEGDMAAHLATLGVPHHPIGWVVYRIDATGALDIIQHGYRVGVGSIDTTNPAEHVITFELNEQISQTGVAGAIAVTRSQLAGVGGGVCFPCSDGVELNSATDEVYCRIKFRDTSDAPKAPNGGYVSVIAFLQAS